MTPGQRTSVIGLATAVFGIGCVAGGRGFVNGDAAAYAAQGWAGDLVQRPIHLGWTALATGLAPLAGPSLPLALDGVNAFFAAIAVVATGVWASRVGGAPWIGALGAAAAVLPWAPFAEVDVPWVACAAVAIVVPAPAAALLVSVGVLFSPTAILAAPWVAAARAHLAAGQPKERVLAPVALGLVAAIGFLTLVSQGAWWTGDRGVLNAPLATPLRALLAWFGQVPFGLFPLVILGTGWVATALATMPLLLAPTDTPAVLPLALTLSLAASRGWSRVPSGRAAQTAGLVLAVQVGQRVLATAFASLQVAEQDAVLRSLAAELEPEDAVVAPFTWGARLGVVAHRDPYGLRWRPADAPLRDQARRWCAAPIARIAVLPPGTRLGAGAADAQGIWWTRPDDPVFERWCTSRDPG